MSKITIRKFQRFPMRELNKFQHPLGRALANLYNLIDYKGYLSDIIADPITPIIKLRPKKRLRQNENQVSIIVATRNNASTIEKSINSLLKQSHQNIEIIVIDDASDDNSVDTINQIAASDTRVKVIANETRLGTGLSRNLGLSTARGDYVTFQDGDDYSTPTRIENQLSVFEKMGHVRLSVCNYVRVNETGNTLEINDNRVMKCIISMMFPREEIIKRIGYFKDQTVGEDSDYYERIKFAFGKSSEIVIFKTLYKALMRENSSFFSNFKLTKEGDYQFSAVDIVSPEIDTSHFKNRSRTADLYIDINGNRLS